MDKKQAISMDGVMDMHTVLCQKSPDTPPAANKTAMALSNVFVFLFINHSLLYPKNLFFTGYREGGFSILFHQANSGQFLLLSLSKTFSGSGA